jgi:cyclic peptide transporter
MYILRMLSKRVWILVLIAVIGIVNSILYSCILLFITNAANKQKGSFNRSIVIFSLLLIFSFLCRKYFQTYIIKFTNTILFDFELSILNRIRQTNYESFMKLGIQRVYTAIGDTKVIAQIPRFFVDVSNNLVIIICGLGYLFWISPLAALGTIAMSSALIVLYVIRNKQLSKTFNKIRDLENDYHQYLQDLLYGFKEIKLSSVRRFNLFDKFISQNRYSTRDMEIEAATGYMGNELIGSYGWFILLGLIVFILPQFYELSTVQTNSFMVIIMYLIGPIMALMGAIPFLTRINVAQNRVQGFEEDLSTYIQEGLQIEQSQQITEKFESITFDDVQFSYHNKASLRKFEVGPISVNIKKGEVIFVKGENGSGKSTFLLLLNGLLHPSKGTISFNNIAINQRNYESYSDQISTVFVDAHLFSANYDNFEIHNTNPELTYYIDLMKISSKVKVLSKIQRLDANLSKGQQKRLALIYSLLEHKDIIILDEWAAEQDPYFRAYFYTELLPVLKRAGKTIIAVTHDDHYFDCADRVIRFEKGIITEDYIQTTKTLLYHEYQN